MKNLLANVHRIIHFELLGKAKNYLFPPEGYTEETNLLFQEDAMNVITKFDEIKLLNPTKGEAAWIVNSYQEQISHLIGTMSIILDELDLTINDTSISGTWHEFMMETIEYLEYLMNQLMIRHSDLFNLEKPMPELTEALFVKKTNQMLLEEWSKLPEGSEAHESFKLLFMPLEEPIGSFCYGHIYYFEVLIKDTIAIINENKEEKPDEKIKHLLWKMDFNHPSYISILWKEYEEVLRDSQGTERVRRCLQLRRKVRLNKPNNVINLYNFNPSLFEQSEIWLNTELNCTRALMVTESIISANPFAEFKVKTKLSLRQLAGILKFFSEKGILLNEDRRELIRFFAAYFVPVSGKRFSLAALTRSYDQYKSDNFIQQIKGLLD